MRSKIISVVSTLFITAMWAHAQGVFQNLNFEGAAPVSAGNPLYPDNVTAASAFPNWTITVGGVQQTEVSYNDGSLGAPEVTLLGPPPPLPGNPVIDGSYSVLLTGSGVSSLPAISQAGLIPVFAQSLFFEAQSAGFGSLAVQLGTQNVPFIAVGSGPNYTLYGANISAWAGNTESLTFTAEESTSGLNNWVIDDISFSPLAVPEPNPLALTGIGGLMFALYRRFAPKRP